MNQELLLDPGLSEGAAVGIHKDGEICLVPMGVCKNLVDIRAGDAEVVLSMVEHLPLRVDHRPRLSSVADQNIRG